MAAPVRCASAGVAGPASVATRAVVFAVFVAVGIVDAVAVVIARAGVVAVAVVKTSAPIACAVPEIHHGITEPRNDFLRLLAAELPRLIVADSRSVFRASVVKT